VWCATLLELVGTTLFSLCLGASVVSDQQQGPRAVFVRRRFRFLEKFFVAEMSGGEKLIFPEQYAGFS
jgi:hypothetical protein